MKSYPFLPRYLIVNKIHGKLEIMLDLLYKFRNQIYEYYIINIVTDLYQINRYYYPI